MTGAQLSMHYLELMIHHGLVALRFPGGLISTSAPDPPRAGHKLQTCPPGTRHPLIGGSPPLCLYPTAQASCLSQCQSQVANMKPASVATPIGDDQEPGLTPKKQQNSGMSSNRNRTQKPGPDSPEPAAYQHRPTQRHAMSTAAGHEGSRSQRLDASRVVQALEKKAEALNQTRNPHAMPGPVERVESPGTLSTTHNGVAQKQDDDEDPVTTAVKWLADNFSKNIGPGFIVNPALTEGNCHGLTFTGGDTSIEPESISAFLDYWNKAGKPNVLVCLQNKKIAHSAKEESGMWIQTLPKGPIFKTNSGMLTAIYGASNCFRLPQSEKRLSDLAQTEAAEAAADAQFDQLLTSVRKKYTDAFEVFWQEPENSWSAQQKSIKAGLDQISEIRGRSAENQRRVVALNSAFDQLKK